jgi:hypothetical protein
LFFAGVALAVEALASPVHFYDLWALRALLLAIGGAAACALGAGLPERYRPLAVAAIGVVPIVTVLVLHKAVISLTVA